MPPTCRRLFTPWGSAGSAVDGKQNLPSASPNKNPHTALCRVVFMLECSPSSRKRNKVRMKGGRWLAKVTARLKPLQTPGLSLVPPIALAIGLAQGHRSALLLSGGAVTFPGLLSSSPERHLPMYSPSPQPCVQVHQRWPLSRCSLSNNPGKNPPAAPLGRGQAKQKSHCMRVARS